MSYYIYRYVINNLRMSTFNFSEKLEIRIDFCMRNKYLSIINVVPIYILDFLHYTISL